MEKQSTVSAVGVAVFSPNNSWSARLKRNRMEAIVRSALEEGVDPSDAETIKERLSHG